MKIAKKILRVLFRACTIATGVTLILFLCASAIYGKPGIEFTRYLRILGFSLTAALLQEVFFIRRLPFVVRLLIHYAVFTPAFVVFFLIGTSALRSGATAFVFLTLFTLAYAVVMGIVFPILRASGYYRAHLARENKHGDEEKQNKPYEKRYS